MKKQTIAFALLTLITVACGTSESAIQTAIAQTAESQSKLNAGESETTIVERRIPDPTSTVENTKTPNPTNTPRPTDTPRPSSTPTPISAAEVLDANWYVASTGSLRFFGSVQNTGETPLSFFQVYVTLRDNAGTLVASDWTYTTLDVLQPGQLSPFMVVFRDDVTGWTEYEINLEAVPSAQEDVYTDLEIISHSGSVRSTGSYQIIGEIKNIGEKTTTFVNVIALLYDAEGNMIATDWTYSDFEAIPPGNTSPFRLIAQDTGLGSIDHYELLVQGRVGE